MIEASRIITQPAQTGQRFGRLTFIRKDIARNGRAMWRLKCDCGKEIVARASHVKAHETKSCGCFSIESSRIRAKKHGHAWPHSPEYNSWHQAKMRCRNPKDPNYVRYGGRGITFCKRWESFENFLADMGLKPSPEYSIERIDNSKGYEPDNCKWASSTEQANNRRSNRVITFNGRSKTLAQWARHTGIRWGVLWRRLDLGWSVGKTLFTPVGGS